MIIHVTMYGGCCDNCGRDFEDFEGFSAKSDEDKIREDMESEGWYVFDNKHYCPKCHTIDENDNLVILQVNDNQGLSK